MLICLYGEMRDALWPERGLSGSVALRAAAVVFRSVLAGVAAARPRSDPRTGGKVLRSI